MEVEIPSLVAEFEKIPSIPVLILDFPMEAPPHPTKIVHTFGFWFLDFVTINPVFEFIIGTETGV